MYLESSPSIDPSVVLVVYRPTCTSRYELLMQSVAEYIGVAPHVVTMGDLNYDLLIHLLMDICWWRP